MSNLPSDQKVYWMTKNTNIDFLDSSIEHDKILVVEGQKFYVISKLLSLSSEFFQGLFDKDSGFKEATEKEIELKDVKAEEFKDFLVTIYPTTLRPTVTIDNYRHLLSLATRFLSGIVVGKCRLFIVDNFDKLDALDILEIAFEYEMEDLKAKVAVFLRRDTSVTCSACKEYCCNCCDRKRFGYLQHNYIRSDDSNYLKKNIVRIKELPLDIQSFVLHVLIEPGKTPI